MPVFGGKVVTHSLWAAYISSIYASASLSVFNIGRLSFLGALLAYGNSLEKSVHADDCPI
jgi:hypothetical protein